MRLRTSIFAMVCMIAGCGARAQNSPASSRSDLELDLPSYTAELDRCAAALRQGVGVNRLRESLPLDWVVQTEHSRVVVSTDWLVSGLLQADRDPTKPKAVVHELLSRLAAMRQAAAELERGSPQSSTESARARLDNILQRREFAGAKGPSQSELFADRIDRWIAERMIRLLSLLHVGRTTGNIITWTIVALALGVFCYWIWQTLLRMPRSPRSAQPGATPGTSAELRQWARDALAAAERGDYREAVHCSYWATIVHLETLGLLRRDHSRTPRESLHLLDPHAKERQLLGDFTRHFELIWYGYRPASPDDWMNARTHLEKMGCLKASTPATANS